MALLKVENLSFRYSESQVNALENVNFEVNEGEFVVIFGRSGCGKSTLLRLIKPQISPVGERVGDVVFDGVKVNELDFRRAVAEIGYVGQNPDNQIVTDNVLSELSFGLENLGESPQTIRIKIAEICASLNIEQLLNKSIDTLSGGQKQLINLAAVLVMRPRLLLLDEPSASLDPVAAYEFLTLVKRLAEEFAIAVILVDHRLDAVFASADKVAVMEGSTIVDFGAARAVASRRVGDMFLPSATRIFHLLGDKGECPITVREGRSYIDIYNNEMKNKIEIAYNFDKKVIEAVNLWFRYSKNEPDILKGVNIDIFENEFLCICGANGAGKTTLLGVLGGLHRAYEGRVKVFGKHLKEYKGGALYNGNLAILPQNPALVFVKNTLFDDFKEVASKVNGDEKIISIAKEFDIEKLLNRNPCDLSGGELQRAAIAKLLLRNPRIVLLDEPTKGIDCYAKAELNEILARLRARGVTIAMVSHDVEFAAQYCTRCVMLFDGQAVSSATPSEFFAFNSFFTTSAARISRGKFDGAVTVDDVVKLCKINGKRL